MKLYSWGGVPTDSVMVYSPKSFVTGLWKSTVAEISSRRRRASERYSWRAKLLLTAAATLSEECVELVAVDNGDFGWSLCINCALKTCTRKREA
jgi:hypothetical protein